MFGLAVASGKPLAERASVEGHPFMVPVHSSKVITHAANGGDTGWDRDATDAGRV